MGKITFGLPAMDKGYFSQNEIEKIYYNNIEVYTSTIKLKTPTVSLSGSVLTITPGDTFSTTFVLIENNVEIYEIARVYQPTTTYNLSNLGLSTGNHTLTVIARANDCYDSDPTDAIVYLEKKLTTPVVSLSGDTLTMTPADIYTATFVIMEGSEVLASVSPGLNPSATYDLSTLRLLVGNHTIKVVARATGFYDSAPTSGVSYYGNKLVTPDVYLNGDVLTITPEDTDTTSFWIIEGGTTVYTINLGGQSSVTCDLSTIELSVGEHELYVESIATGFYNSDPTDDIYYTMYGQCSTPIAAMMSNGYELAFTAVAHAASYTMKVSLGASTWYATGITVPPTRYDVRNVSNFGPGVYSVQIMAVGEQYYFDSEYSTADYYYVLAAPTNVSVSGVVATFDKVDNADGYKLYVDGNLLGSYTPASLSTATVTVNLESFSAWWNLSAGAHTLTVTATRTNSLDGVASAGASFSKMPKLDTPQNVAVSDTIATFDEVEHAEQYQVYIDGTSIGTVYAPIAPPVRNEVSVSISNSVNAKSSFIDEAEEYEYFIDGQSIGKAPLSFSVWGYPALMGQSGSNCAVYAKVNSDTVSTTDYTWYVESNGTIHGPSMSNPISNVTKVAIMSSRNDGRPMATCVEWTIQQSTTPVVAKLHGDNAIALIYGPANS